MVRPWSAPAPTRDSARSGARWDRGAGRAPLPTSAIASPPAPGPPEPATPQRKRLARPALPTDRHPGLGVDEPHHHVPRRSSTVGVGLRVPHRAPQGSGPAPHLAGDEADRWSRRAVCRVPLPTNRVARSPTSGEYRVRRSMTPPSHRVEPPANPGQFTTAKFDNENGRIRPDGGHAGELLRGERSRQVPRSGQHNLRDYALIAGRAE